MSKSKKHTKKATKVMQSANTDSSSTKLMKNSDSSLSNIIGNSLRKNENNYDKKSYKLSLTALVISTVISVVAIALPIVVSVTLEKFNRKSAPLNYQIVCESYPGTIEYENEYPRLTWSPYCLTLKPYEVSGEFVKVIFASVIGDDVNLVPYTIDTKRMAHIYDDAMFYVHEINKDEIQLYFFTTLEYPKVSYGTLHLILQGYNGEYYTFSMIYSTKDYKPYFFDNITIHNSYDYSVMINELGISDSMDSIKARLLKERSMILGCLDN